MKGVVLAGGTGSRLRPLTNTMPKQMIPVGGKPVLEHIIDDLREAGISEIGIVLGEYSHEEVREYFGDGTSFGVEITYIYQGEPLGLGHAVACTEPFVGDEPFVLYLGDDLIQRSLSDFVSGVDLDTYAGAIALKYVENPSRYGIVKTNEAGDVVGIVEKPDDPPTDLAGIGVFVFTPKIFDEIEQVEPSSRGEVELTHAIERLLSNGRRIKSAIVEGWWFDVGTPADAINANRAVLDELPVGDAATSQFSGSVIGRVRVGEGTKIHTEATIRGPAYVGEEVEVGPGSYIGPYSTIADRSVIEGASIESSIVLQDAEITTGAHIVDSIIGRAASVGESNDRPDGFRLVVGSDSEVQMR